MLSWSHVEDEGALRALGGDIEVMRSGGAAERVIGTACVAQDCGSREGALLCHGVVVCGWASGSSVNKCTFFILVYILRCMIFITVSDIHSSQ